MLRVGHIEMEIFKIVGIAYWQNLEGKVLPSYVFLHASVGNIPATHGVEFIRCKG